MTMVICEYASEKELYRLMRDVNISKGRSTLRIREFESVTEWYIMDEFEYDLDLDGQEGEGSHVWHDPHLTTYVYVKPRNELAKMMVAELREEDVEEE